MSPPALHVFAISHYCEKARWALEHLGIEHRTVHLAPGVHVRVAKKLGAPRSSLPILTTGVKTIQGSAGIIDWADDATSTESKRLTPERGREECRAVEKRLDDVLGVHVRRYYYSEALVDHPETVRPIFTRELSWTQKLLVTAAWGRICKVMIERMDLGPEQRLDSRDRVAGELDWLDELLSDGRPFLVGDRLSRADLTAASLAAPLALPSEHPVYANLQLPPQLSAEVAEWQDRRSLAWVRELYAEYR